MGLGPFLVHAQEHLRPILGFRTPSAGIDTDNRISRVGFFGKHFSKFGLLKSLLEGLGFLKNFLKSVVIVGFDRELKQRLRIRKTSIKILKPLNLSFQTSLLLRHLL